MGELTVCRADPCEGKEKKGMSSARVVENVAVLRKLGKAVGESSGQRCPSEESPISQYQA